MSGNISSEMRFNLINFNVATAEESAGRVEGGNESLEACHDYCGIAMGG